MTGRREERFIHHGTGTRRLTRRDMLRLGLTGAVLSCLNPACEKSSGRNAGPRTPEPPEPPFVLTDGKTLYDDFDGHGNLQSYNGQHLAEVGKLSSLLWNVWSGWGTGDVVENGAARGLLTVVNEDGQRVEYVEEESREIKPVFDAGGRLIEAVPHIPGEPYHSSRELILRGAGDGCCETENGKVSIQKGRTYGTVQAMVFGPSGYGLKMTTYSSIGMSCELCHPVDVGFADNKSFSADVMASSTSTTKRFRVVLDIHTTIPEQPPGKSWFSQIGIGTVLDENLCIVAQCGNVNTGYRFFKYLGKAEPDRWYNLRQDIVTRKDDGRLKENELRVDFYLDGALAASEIPEDSELLLDPARTGIGPKRILTLANDWKDGTSVAFLDNVKAVYKNQVS